MQCYTERHEGVDLVSLDENDTTQVQQLTHTVLVNTYTHVLWKGSI